MNGFQRMIAPALVAALAASFTGWATSAPASAQVRPDCSSDRNLMHVHRRLDGAVDQLSHDQHDYDGHRVEAMNDLQRARGELVAAEQYARYTDRDNPACFAARGGTGGSDANWGDRGQPGSNQNLLGVRRWVEGMIDQLQRDERDYGGHRVAAIGDMQQARTELIAAERSRR